MDYRVARILRFIIYAIVALLCILVLYVGYNGIKNVLKPAASKAPTKTVKLSDYQNSGGKLKYAIDGPIVALEEHEQVVVTISSNQRIIEVIRGYNQVPVFSKSFDNDQASFDAFISVINNYGFTRTKIASPAESRTGSCAFGDKFSYQVISSGSTLDQDTWNNSCNLKQGTFGGNSSTVSRLFEAQIPDYSEIVSATY